ncbi:MAG: outer membrane protein transport protein [Myxococcales bacterium]|nr:outer membrane protein transport protein [Myxococcales bacterium]
MRRTVLLALAIALLSMGVATEAMTGGLYVNEFGTSSMGVAGAGANARANDASTAFHNPAGMTRLDDHQFMGGLAAGISEIRFNSDPDTPSTSGGDGGDQGGFFPIVGSQYVHKLTDRFRLGMSLFSISGAALDPGDEWVGRNEVTELTLLTITAMPSVAFRATDWLSIGGGVGVSYGSIDFDLRSPLPLLLEPKIKIDNADDFALAWTVGVLLEPDPGLRFGVVYQSKTELELDGDLKIGGNSLPGIDLDLDLAQAVRMGVYWDVTDRFAVLLSAAWEDWSELKNIPLSVGGVGAALPINFKDTWKGGIGFEYQLLDALRLQTGFMWDTSPVRQKDRIASFPIDRQFRIATGARYNYSDALTLGVSFVYIDLGKSKLNTGNLKGHYNQNRAFVLGFNMQWKQLPWGGRGTW